MDSGERRWGSHIVVDAPESGSSKDGIEVWEPLVVTFYRRGAIPLCTRQWRRSFSPCSTQSLPGTEGKVTGRTGLRQRLSTWVRGVSLQSQWLLLRN